MKSITFLLSFCIIGHFINGENVMEKQLKEARVEIKNLNDVPIAVILNDRKKDHKSTIRVDSSELYTDEVGRLDQQGSSVQVDEYTSGGLETDNNNIHIISQDTMKKFQSEMAAGDPSEILGENVHVEQAKLYNDLGRRFVPQYKYTGPFESAAAEHEDDLVPERAPPELVMLVAKESANIAPDKNEDLGTDANRKKILRSGDYWNGVWKEEPNMKSFSRSGTQKKVLGSIKAKIKPGTEFYKVVSRMRKISPRLLYIINKKQV